MIVRGAVLVAVLTVGALLTGCAGCTAGQPRAAESGTPAPNSQVTTSPEPPSPHLAAASAEADSLLALVPRLPGGRGLPGAPGGPPRGQRPLAVPVGTVARSAWFIAAGSVGQAIQFLRSHVPVGLVLTPAAPGVVDGAVSYRARASRDYTSAVLTVVVVAVGQQVAAHAEVLVAAVGGTGPTGALGTVPTDVSAVDVALTRPGSAATTARTLVGRPAASLAATVDTLGQPPSGIVSCMADTGARDVLTFHTSGGVVVVTVKPDPCGTVKVAHAGVWQVLSGAAVLDRAILAALGLPTAGR